MIKISIFSHNGNDQTEKVIPDEYCSSAQNAINIVEYFKTYYQNKKIRRVIFVERWKS